MAEILKYFKKVDDDHLPSPLGPLSQGMRSSSMKAANKLVKSLLAEPSAIADPLLATCIIINMGVT